MSSQSNKTILVTGSTGNVGFATIKHLAKLLNENNTQPGFIVRAGVRDEKKAADKFKEIKFNNNTNNKLEFTSTETSADSKTPDDKLLKSFNGVDTVVILPPGPGRVEVGISFVSAAKSAQVKNIVLLSVSAVADGDKVLFGRQFGAIEQAVKESNINYSILRSPFFLDNHWGNVGTIKSQSAFYYPVKPESKYVQISTNDLGEAIANVVLNTDKHKNKTYTLTSNESISNKQFAEYYSEITGKTVNFVQVPDSAAVDAMVGMGFPKWQSEGIVELWHNAEENKDSAVKVTNDFKFITGHEPTTPKQFIQSLTQALQ